MTMLDADKLFFVGVTPPTGDYEDLDNKPAIDGVELHSDTTKADLGLDTVFVYKGQVNTYNDLPKTGNHTGDTWNVKDTGENYCWNGTGWDCLSGSTTVYYNDGELDSSGSPITIDYTKNNIINMKVSNVENDLHLISGKIKDTSSTIQLDEIVVNKLTKTEYDNLPTIEDDELYAVDLELTGGKALISTPNGDISESSITTTELNQLEGIRGNIQQQIDERPIPVIPTKLSEFENDTHFIPYEVKTVGTTTQMNELVVHQKTKTEVSAEPLNEKEIYLIDPEYSGNKVLITSSEGDITESTVTDTKLNSFISGEVKTSSTTTQLEKMVINKLTQQEYDGSTKNPNELYLITDKTPQTVQNMEQSVSSSTTKYPSSYAVKTIVDTKQPTINDINTIRSNATAGKSAADTIATYGNIVTHNTSEFLSSTTKYAKDLSYNNSKLQLKDQDGNLIGTEVTITSGGGTWGSITGTLSNQTDLQNALDKKLENITFTSTDFRTVTTIPTSIPFSVANPTVYYTNGTNTTLNFSSFSCSDSNLTDGTYTWELLCSSNNNITSTTYGSSIQYVGNDKTYNPSLSFALIDNARTAHSFAVRMIKHGSTTIWMFCYNYSFKG